MGSNHFSKKQSEYFGHLLSDIYREIKNIDSEIAFERTSNVGSDFSERCWVKTFDPDYGKTTWILHGNAEDRAKGWVGTNNQLVVTELSEDGYHFVDSEDLKTRTQLLFDVVEDAVNLEKKSNKFNLKWTESKYTQFYGLFNKIKAKFFNDSPQWKTDLQKMKNIEERTRHFEEKYAIAMKAMKETTADVITALHEVDPSFDYLTWKRNLIQKEKDFIQKCGRPNIINIGTISNKAYTNSREEIKRIKVLSAQLTQGQNTTPSTKRGLGKISEEIPNHVQSIKGVIITEENDEQNKEIVMVDSIQRNHVSYSHFLVKDHYERSLANDRDLQQVINAIACNMKRSKSSISFYEQSSLFKKYDVRIQPDETIGSKENPLLIPLTSMILLTPKWGKRFENMGIAAANVWLALRGMAKINSRESEYSQLSQVVVALEKMRYKSMDLVNHDVTVETPLAEEQSLCVKFDPNYMNVPVNIGRNQHFIFSNTLQRGVNARGMVEYNLKMKKYLHDAMDVYKQDSSVKNLIESSQNIFLEIFENEQIKNKIAVIKEKINQKEYDLFKLVSNLDSAEKNILKEGNNKKKLKLKKDYCKIELKFYNSVKERNRLYYKINNLQKESYKKFQKQLSGLQQRVERQLIASTPQPSYFDKSKPQQERFRFLKKGDPTAISSLKQANPALLTLQRYLMSLDLFYNGKYKYSKNAYHFQSLYVLNNQAFDREVEAFCKSAEDRTGWHNVMIDATTTFTKLYGYHPRFNQSSDREIMNQFIIDKTCQLSAALQNTAENSRARGFQIFDRFTGGYYAAIKAGRLVARSAKNLFNNLKYGQYFFNKLSSAKRLSNAQKNGHRTGIFRFRLNKRHNKYEVHQVEQDINAQPENKRYRRLSNSG